MKRWARGGGVSPEEGFLAPALALAPGVTQSD